MYVVRFVRKDGKQDEEYYYCQKNDAIYHFSLFNNDNSDLYKTISLLEIGFEADKILCVFNGKSGKTP